MTTKLNYSTIRDFSDLTAKVKAITKKGTQTREDFVQLSGAAVAFFYGEGNRQISIVNQLVEAAYECGYNGGHYVDWIVNMIPHKVGKDKENTKRFVFTGKEKDKEYDELVALSWLTANPSPFNWENGGNSTPKAFDPKAAIHIFLTKCKKNNVNLEEVQKIFAAELEAASKAA